MKRRFLTVVSLLVGVCWGCVNDGRAEPGPSTTTATAAAVVAGASLPQRIAREFAQASPPADPGDARARDLAATRLSECGAFLSATGERLLWGGCEPVKGYDPGTYSLTELDPLVWLKLYGSMLMFSGQYEIKPSGPFTVLELQAKFRGNLDPGEYPYPFWHSPKKWQAYVDLCSLCIVFRDDRVVAVYRVADPDAAAHPADRKWDGAWRWTDASGNPQPRVALFSYLFSGENPHRASVDAAYRRLEKELRTHECTTCHAPNNAGKAKALLLLNYPNQSLLARRSLLRTLENNEMPPGDDTRHTPVGLQDTAERAELIELAKTFVREADAAFAFESTLRAGRWAEKTQ